MTRAGREPADDLRRRAVAERRAVRGHAVSDGGRADADLRHHERHQPGARLAVHARRLCRRRERRRLRLVPDRAGGGPGRRGRGRYRARNQHLPHALPARPSRPGAGDVRPHPVLQRAGADRLGLDRALHAHPVLSRRPGRDSARHPLSGLPAGDHRGRPRRRAFPVPADRADPARHADPRRRVEPGHARRARGQYRGAVHLRVRARRGAGGAGRERWPVRSSRSNPGWAKAF